MRRTLLLAVLAIVAASSAPALARPSSGSTVPKNRVARLAKVATISQWFAYRGDSDEQLAGYASPADLARLRSEGFTGVRLVVTPQILSGSVTPQSLEPRVLAHLDAAIQRLFDADLAVALDIHDGNKTAWEKSRSYVDGMNELWSELAAHYRDTNPGMLYLELLNEPVFRGGKAKAWFAIQKRLLATVRAQAPDHTIIATSWGYGNVDGLLEMKPLADRNVVYTFHYYEPYEFTHQGAPWAERNPEAFHDLPYPMTRASCAPIIARQVPDLRSILRTTCNAVWGPKRINERIALAAKWGSDHRVPLWLGEFGVYCKSAPRASAVRWIHDIRVAAQSRGIGWGIWDADGCFGLRPRLDATIASPVDARVVRALGLKG